jgi:YqjK-like protein
MASARLGELVARREALIDRATRERDQLAELLGEVRHHALRADARITHAQRVLTHPLVIAGVVGAVVLVGPRRLFSTARSSGVLWLLLRNGMPIARRALSRWIG